MRLWTEGIVSRVKAFLPAGGRKTVVMAAAGRLWLAEMEKGKYLAKKSAALPKITEESLAEAFSSLSGIGEREIILIYNSSDLHTVCRTFPAMTEEELAETMYWEQDRIFGVREDLRLSWKALSEDAVGWTVSLAGVREESVACWQSAAEKAGRKITRCIPVTAVELPRPRRPLYLYGRGKSAFFLFREEHVQESRILNMADADKKLQVFLRHLSKSYDMEGRDIIFIPMSGGVKEIPFWKDLAERWREKIKILPLSGEIEEPDDFTDPADEREAFSEESGEEDHLVKTFAYGEEMEEGLWTILLPVMEAAADADMDFLAGEKRKALLTGEVDWLRAGQAVSALSAGAGILCAIFLGYTSLEEREAEAKLAGLSDVRIEMEAERKEQEKENQLLSELKSLEENDFRWEQKLVALSECTPQGIVLSEINAGEGTVHITGTADSPVTAMRFQKELEKAWGGKIYIEKQKREPNLKMAAFTLLWKGGQP
ncbi:PilN domain-containing protein [Dialister invisus]|uniref:PilN domain-containing protein n=1 Tax=Dialister invisus TaxID=218538 RepID=UPI0026746E69|nr:PilN domain-containing protein [Dialister invisus]